MMRYIPEFQVNWLDVVEKKLSMCERLDKIITVSKKQKWCVRGQGVDRWQSRFCEKWDVHCSTPHPPWNYSSSPSVCQSLAHLKLHLGGRALGAGIMLELKQ